jgi:hypothetical protein
VLQAPDGSASPFPPWARQSIQYKSTCPGLNDAALDVLGKMEQANPQEAQLRICNLSLYFQTIQAK